MISRLECHFNLTSTMIDYQRVLQVIYDNVRRDISKELILGEEKNFFLMISELIN